MKYADLTEAGFDKNIEYLLQQKGYKYLGRGVDQQAWLDPDKKTVIKIFGTSLGTNSASKDKATYFDNAQRIFIVWAKFCMKSKNKFLPKFYGLESFEFEGRVYIQSRQEILYNFGYEVAIKLEHLADEADNGLKIAQQYNWYMKLCQLYGKDTIEKLFATICALKKISDSSTLGIQMDLNYRNFMMRKNGTIVINDPWVSQVVY